MATQVIPWTRATRATGRRLIQIVATPGSGGGHALETARELRAALRTRGHSAQLKLFSDLENLRGWAATDGGRFSRLICVGGDGTMCAAAAAAVRWSVPFLPVPSGFGNLFARALGHGNRVEGVVDLLEHGELVHVDVGARNGQLFLCQESFGLLAQIQEGVEAALDRPRARWRRWLAYYRAALGHLRNTPLPTLRVVVDGRVLAREAAIVTVANVETYGAWLKLTPEASPIDGLFDVFVMTGASRREILVRLLQRHLRLPGTEHGTLLSRGRRVSVIAPHSARDRLELRPRVLPVLVSPKTAATLVARANEGVGRAQAA
ncbi:MAG: diacylglycerol/lipid kinase family protein [Candidatus Rokuibacteriota bacterium]